MAQYPIPQFIESEGKIISFLTFSQFFWLVGGGAFCLLFYYTLPFFLFVMLSIITGLIVGAIAFLKVDNTSIMTIIFNFIGFSTTSKNYVWKKKESAYPFKIKRHFKIDALPQEPATYQPKEASSLKEAKKLVELSKKK